MTNEERNTIVEKYEAESRNARDKADECHDRSDVIGSNFWDEMEVLLADLSYKIRHLKLK